MLSRLELLIGKENLEILKNSSVLIVGLGGVGGYVVESLARSGVGTFHLVDYDVVDLSNCNRQLIATNETIGRKKTELWKERIQAINPNTNVMLYDAFYDLELEKQIFQHKIDFIIDACDTVKAKQQLILYGISHQIPVLSCMGTGNRMDPTQLEIMELSSTKNDPLAKIMRKWKKDTMIKQKIMVLSSKEVPKKLEGRIIGSSSFVPGTAGLMMASYVLKQLIESKQKDQ